MYLELRDPTYELIIARVWNHILLSVSVSDTAPDFPPAQKLTSLQLDADVIWDWV